MSKKTEAKNLYRAIVEIKDCAKSIDAVLTERKVPVEYTKEIASLFEGILVVVRKAEASGEGNATRDVD